MIVGAAYTSTLFTVTKHKAIRLLQFFYMHREAKLKFARLSELHNLRLACFL